MAARFFSTCSVCCSIPPLMMLPVVGSIGTCPEIKTNPLALIACEYGPMAPGALRVETTSRVKLMKCLREIKALIFNDCGGIGNLHGDKGSCHPERSEGSAF